MRSLLFVPGDSERKLEKAPASGADALIVDFEDAVGTANKAQARQVTAEMWPGLKDAADGPALYIRINDLDSGLWEADLDAAVPLAPTGIMLPKARSGSDVRTLSDALVPRERDAGLVPDSIQVLVLAAETPEGLLQMASFQNCGPRLAGLTWGGEDLATAIGALANRDADNRYTPPMMLARNLCLHGAAAAGVQAIDTVYTDFRDLAGLEEEARFAARDGFTGKMAIHPAQVEVINAVFTPSAEAVAHARAIVDAFEADPGAGVVSIDGRMIDRPHLVMAERLLRQARLAGVA